MVNFKEYRIEDVLTWQPQKEIDPLKIPDLTVKSNIVYPFYGQATLTTELFHIFLLQNVY